MTFQSLWYFSFGDISVLVTIQFLWHFCFGDISVLVTFQFWWLISFGDISVIVLGTFQFWLHFSFDLDPLCGLVYLDQHCWPNFLNSLPLHGWVDNLDLKLHQSNRKIESFPWIFPSVADFFSFSESWSFWWRPFSI